MHSKQNSIPVVLSLVAAVSLLTCSLAGCGFGDGTQSAANISANSTNTGENESARPAGIDASAPSNVASPSQAPPRDVVVVFQTTLGDIRVKLFDQESHRTVDNFLDNYVKRGQYDGTIFHHVEAGSMIIGGGYTEDMQLVETRTPVLNEATNELKNERGTLAMVRHPEYPDSATNQFFFNLVDNPALDHQGRDTAEDFGYCVFGKVIEGMDVLDKIAATEVKETDGFTHLPVETIRIDAVRVEE